MTIFSGARNGRVLHLEDPTATGRRDLVVALRESDAYPLPQAAWDADDENGLVVLCRDGEVPLASARAVEYRRGDGRELPYLPDDMIRALPAEAERIVFCDRLVVARGARSLDLLALLLHVAATLGIERLGGLTGYVTAVKPANERLMTWFGARRLTGPLPMRGLATDGVLMAGEIREGATRAGEILSARGWVVTRHSETAPPKQETPPGAVRRQYPVLTSLPSNSARTLQPRA